MGAFYALGYLYENGLGETANSDKAKTWYLLAADLAHDQAAASLCNLLFSQPGKPPDYREARNWCELAIQVLPGDSHVQLALGSMYLNGWGGKTNKESAFKWLKHAADNGLPDAQFRLGYHLSTFLQDDTQARSYYERAAEQGHATSALNLGSLLQSGSGGDKDILGALKWYSLAAASGDQRFKADAEFAIASLYFNGDDS